MKQLQEFAEIANETKGASFTLTRTKKREWTIAFPNLYNAKDKVGVKVTNANLRSCIEDASNYLKQNRVEVAEQVIKYEI
jgi:hypothetical protein